MTTRAALDSDSNPMRNAFSQYANYLNDLNDKRHNMNSKKVIFQVHRIGKNNKEVLEKAEKDLSAVMDQQISRLVKELKGTESENRSESWNSLNSKNS